MSAEQINPSDNSAAMPDSVENIRMLELKPLPYHEAMRDYLKEEEAGVWHWYASNKVRDEQAETVRFELLKSTYRVEREAQPETYAAAEDVARKLGRDVPITIYQAQNPQGLNGSLAYDPLADIPHFASARLIALYNEVFCDRGSLLVAGDPLVVISMLLKVETQLDEVSPESYLRQAEEVFGHAGAKTEGLSHPEAFIRARALKLWADREPQSDRKIQEMLEGRPALNRLKNELRPLEHFDAAMQGSPQHVGISLRQLLRRGIELRGELPELSPLQRERLPDYATWWRHRERLIHSKRTKGYRETP